ncbi:MAG TPA: hypothetical protein VN442_05525 [Bryobacteraceae bacterium]|nr:hypothetical protein [Bryobacteraceae bacterium]
MGAAAKVGYGLKAAACLVLAAAGWLGGATHYVTITGLGGEPDYEQRFAGWGKDIGKALEGEARVRTLIAPGRDHVRAAFEEVAREAKPDDALVVMLIGHGTFDGLEYKFNLPGRDLSAAELAGMLDRVPAARQLVVNMTSASGGSLAALAKPQRMVIAATKSGTEKNATVFARYWAEALRDPAADTDKNETVSALEAFQYAERKTKAFYETEKRIATEHAVLEDKGAAAFPLLRLGANAAASRDPAKMGLLAKKEELEQRIDRLKYQKAAIPADEYKKQLMALLLELARTQEELDK